MSSLPNQNVVVTERTERVIGAPVINQQTNFANLQNQALIQNQRPIVNVSETEQTIDVTERRIVHNTNITSAQGKTIVDTQKHLATEIPITTEKHTMHEYVPVTMEKIIQRIPVVVGQRVTTGCPLTGDTNIEALGVQYVQQQVQTEVDLQPRMQTRIGQTEVVSQQVVGGNQIITQQQPVTQQYLQNQQFQNQQLLQSRQLSGAQQFQNISPIQSQQFTTSQQFQSNNANNQFLQNQQLQNQQFANQLHNQQSQQLNQIIQNQQNQQFLNQQNQNQQFQTNQFAQNQNLLNQRPLLQNQFSQSSNLLQTQNPAIATTVTQQSPNTFITKIQEHSETRQL